MDKDDFVPKYESRLSVSHLTTNHLKFVVPSSLHAQPLAIFQILEFGRYSKIRKF